MIILLNFFYSDTGFFKVNTLKLAFTFDKEIHIKYYDTITGRLLHIFVTLILLHACTCKIINQYLFPNTAVDSGLPVSHYLEESFHIHP